jgi:hypothetical protein
MADARKPHRHHWTTMPTPQFGGNAQVEPGVPDAWYML